MASNTLPNTLQFPGQNSRSRSPVLYDMKRIDNIGRGAHLVISGTVCIHNGHSKVYRATLNSEGHPSYDVVCKVATGKQGIARLSHEAQMYYHLRDLQGDVIPFCYGLFEGELEDGPSACLITDYCGDPPKQFLNRADDDLKVHAIEALTRIHDEGVQHNDFKEWNMVVDQNKRLFIIDFDCAEKHECHVAREIKVGGHVPERDEFGCDEVWYACNYICDIWAPDELASQAPEGTPQDVALEKARETIRWYRSYVGVPVEEGE